MRIGTNSKKLDISSEINTKKVSERFAEFLKPGDLVCLFGDLGVGKTTFIKYLINYLQKKFQENTTEVSSPTFNILNEYKINNINIHHYDLYSNVNIPIMCSKFSVFKRCSVFSKSPLEMSLCLYGLIKP